jgi:hypothetical protein
MTSRRLWTFALVLLPGALTAGCSLVNSFDDVVPLTDANDSGTLADSSLSADSGAKSDSSMDSGSKADSTLGTDANADSGPGQDSSTGEDAADAGDTAPTGVIVVAATQLSGDGGFVLTALNPFSGAELGTREKTTVFSVKYDGNRDIWYVFDDPANAFGFAQRNELVTLHVRSLDTHTGAWTELGSLVVPAIESNDNVAVLNGRLVYVGYVPTVDAGTPDAGHDSGPPDTGVVDEDASEDGGTDDAAVVDADADAGVDAAPPPSGLELVVIDTTNPSAPALINPSTPIPNILGLIGSRGTGVGGNVNLFYAESNCTGAGIAEVCPVDVLHYLVQSTGAPIPPNKPVQLSSSGAPITMPKTGRPALGSYIRSGVEDLVAIPAPPLAADASATLYPLSPTNQNIVGTPSSVPVQASLLSLLAVSECQSEAFLAGLPSDTRVYATPILPSSPALASVDLGRSAQSFAFEPYSSTLIAPFDDAKVGTIDAYRYALSTTGTGWVLQNRAGTDWTPPSDLDPKVIAVREPIPFPASDICTP